MLVLLRMRSCGRNFETDHCVWNLKHVPIHARLFLPDAPSIAPYRCRRQSWSEYELLLIPIWFLCEKQSQQTSCAHRRSIQLVPEQKSSKNAFTLLLIHCFSQVTSWTVPKQLRQVIPRFKAPLLRAKIACSNLATRGDVSRISASSAVHWSSVYLWENLGSAKAAAAAIDDRKDDLPRSFQRVHPKHKK